MDIEPTVLDQLNEYKGENAWEDLILGLPGYDEAATVEVDCEDGRDFVAGGVHYRFENGRWIVR